MVMSMNTRAEILQMVADGVITQEEADRLIDALGASEQKQSDLPEDEKPLHRNGRAVPKHPRGGGCGRASTVALLG